MGVKLFRSQKGFVIGEKAVIFFKLVEHNLLAKASSSAQNPTNSFCLVNSQA